MHILQCVFLVMFSVSFRMFLIIKNNIFGYKINNVITAVPYSIISFIRNSYFRPSGRHPITITKCTMILSRQNHNANYLKLEDYKFEKVKNFKCLSVSIDKNA